jgi:ketosteroid isomerase-like protein
MPTTGFASPADSLDTRTTARHLLIQRSSLRVSGVHCCGSHCYRSMMRHARLSPRPCISPFHAIVASISEFLSACGHRARYKARPTAAAVFAYAAAYQKQHSRTQNGRLERTNTFTKLMGDAAWVTYQWEFSGQVDGQPARANGHTTLVLQRRAGSWIIVLNHTSATPSAAQAALPAGDSGPPPENSAVTVPGA